MTLREFLKGIADAIRTVEGSTGDIPAPTYRERILALSGGGGGGGPFAKVSVFEGPDGEIVDIPVNISIGLSVTVEDPKVPPTYTSACNETTGGTTLTGTITAKAGDWVLATVTTRSAATYPDGWTLLHESDYVSQSGTNQKMAFLCKEATAAGEVGCTVNQAASGRIYMNLIAVSNCQGFKYRSGSEEAYNTAATSFAVIKPDYQYVIWGCTGIVFTSGKWACSQISASVIGLSSYARQCNFWDDGVSGARTFVSETDTAAVIDYVEVIA